MAIQNSLTLVKSFPEELIVVKELVYDKCNFNLTNLKLNLESEEYSACSFKLNELTIEHRTSKITPTKTGQFVTVWKRNEHRITAPFDVSDNIDFIVVTAKSNEKLGQFIFPKTVLVRQGVMSQNGKGGKRGIRVYPPWDIAANKQAEKTQRWQAEYFLGIHEGMLVDVLAVKKMFGFQ